MMLKEIKKKQAEIQKTRRKKWIKRRTEKLGF